MLILNFKNYPELSANNGVTVLRDIQNADLNLENIFFAPAVNDLSLFKNIFPTLNFISQTLEDSKTGSTTGHLSYEIVSAQGIKYTILNHSENRVSSPLNMTGIQHTIELIQTFKSAGINVVACCENVEEAVQLAKAEPYAIAFEPKELIGSGVSVTNQSGLVTEFINAVPSNIKKLIGAGVSSGEDIQNGKNLGAQGFLLASAFAKAENKVDKLKEFIQNLQ